MVTAVRLMYAGAAYALVWAIGIIVVSASIVRHHPVALDDHRLAGAVTLAVLLCAAEIALWLGIARACRRGSSGARVAGTVLFAVHTVGVLGVVASSQAGLGPAKVLTLIGWLIGLRRGGGPVAAPVQRLLRRAGVTEPLARPGAWIAYERRMNPVRTRLAVLTCGITGLVAVLHNGGQRRRARAGEVREEDTWLTTTATREAAARPGRGRLRIYLGSAAGVGKTYAMLGEGHRRAERGADVVVGFAEAHARPQTIALLDGLEVVPRATLEYRGATFEEMDVDAVLARRPEIALVDEFAHTNVPGSRNEKRWQDVEELLDAGIDVISAVNIQHLESLNDVVEKITGVPQRETVPDAIVRAADQVELVDMTPEALRRRMAHGNIYPPEKIDAALTNYFRSGNLAALRELALLWLADKVDEGLQRYRVEHKIQGAWEARERVVVALTGGPGGQDADPAGRPDRRPVRGRRPAGRARHQVRRPDRRRSGRAGRAAAAGRVGGRHLPPGRRRRHLRSPADLRPGRERDPARARGQPPVVADRHAHRTGHRRPDHPRLR